MFCINCGKEIPQNSEFCQECGALQGGEVKNSGGAGKKGTKKWIVLIAVITIVCFGIGFLIFHSFKAIGRMPGWQRSREAKDMQTLYMVYSVFEVALAESRESDTCDGTELSGEVAENMERNLGKSIEEVEEEFVSEVCKGQDLYFYFNPATMEISVAVGSREGVYASASDAVFYVSGKTQPY